MTYHIRSYKIPQITSSIKEKISLMSFLSKKTNHKDLFYKNLKQLRNREVVVSASAS